MKPNLPKPPSATPPADEPNITSSGMGAPPVSHGKRIEPILPSDEETTENTVEQGIDEADDNSSQQIGKSSS